MDVSKNLALRQKLWKTLSEIDTRYAPKIDPAFSLNLSKIEALEGSAKTMPDVIVAVATPKGEIVRYFESNDIAAYYGSPYARSRENGSYDPEKEVRAIASVGKMMAAIGLANQGRDTLHSPYYDRNAPGTGLETCRRNGEQKKMRRAEVAFACSLNGPLEWRMARYGQKGSARLIDQFGFTMPYAPDKHSKTPPSTAMVRGLVTAAPRKVHQMATVILASLTGKGHQSVPLPFMVRHFQKSGLENPYEKGRKTSQLRATTDILPNKVIRPFARKRLLEFLQSPLCYHDGTTRHGTLKKLSNWCAARRRDVKLHFAKTGTQVTSDPDQTVDVWVSGGIQFSNGKAYSYVITIGTGNRNRGFARKLHAAQLGVPVLKTLLEDLRAEAFALPAIKTSKAE